MKEPPIPGGKPFGILLAGGKSSRMGREKSLVVVAGQPLWKRQMALLRRCCRRVAVAAGERPNWLEEDAEWVADAQCGEGPVRGLLAALAWTQKAGAPQALVLAVDLPRVSETLLSSLLSDVRAGRGVILQNEDWLDPLCACYPVEALEPLRMLVEGGENKLQRLAARLAEEGLLAIRRLTPSESAEMFNMNTPADLTLLAETLDATRNP